VPPTYDPTPRYSPPQPDIPQPTYGYSGVSSRIETGKASAKALEPEIEKMDSSLESLSSWISRYKQEIDGYERQTRLGLNVDRSLYQQALDKHNALVREHNALLLEREARYAEYSREIDSVNDMVRRFNSGER
jgi:chromosome segregation ATPase